MGTNRNGLYGRDGRYGWRADCLKREGRVGGGHCQAWRVQEAEELSVGAVVLRRHGAVLRALCPGRQPDAGPDGLGGAQRGAEHRRRKRGQWDLEEDGTQADQRGPGQPGGTAPRLRGLSAPTQPAQVARRRPASRLPGGPALPERRRSGRLGSGSSGRCAAGRATRRLQQRSGTGLPRNRSQRGPDPHRSSQHPAGSPTGRLGPGLRGRRRFYGAPLPVRTAQKRKGKMD